MKEERIQQLYIQAYFWSLLTVETLMIMSSLELASWIGQVNTVLFYLALIPLFGYAYQKKIGRRMFWRLFTPVFFLWEAACFLHFYNNPLSINMMLLIMLAPLYWSMAAYTMIAMEPDAVRRRQITEKMDAFREKFRTVIVICSGLALLLLMLSLYVLIRDL